MNPLLELQKYGQSIWLDYIRRDLITSGELKRLISEDGLAGMTSNPAIFEKAITGSEDYADIIQQLDKKDVDSKAIYEAIAIRDIQDAADALKSVYEKTQKKDGYVSLEVSPLLAQNTEGTIAEALRLWKAVNRPNLMIKVPATPEGLPAIKALLAQGINVNITLLFAQGVYVQVVNAYLEGLEEFAKKGGDVSKIASVASFFISRIDTVADTKLNEKIQKASKPEEQNQLKQLLGKVAIANGKLTYKKYKELFSGPRWQALATKGAHPQRVLWASTGTKNPLYSDVLYVEELIGPDTVNTLPPATLKAFRDHGKPRASLEENVAQAAQVLENLEKAGISLTEITDHLLAEGIELFAGPFSSLLLAIDKKRQSNNG